MSPAGKAVQNFGESKGDTQSSAFHQAFLLADKHLFFVKTVVCVDVVPRTYALAIAACVHTDVSNGVVCSSMELSAPFGVSRSQFCLIVLAPGYRNGEYFGSLFFCLDEK